MLIFKPCLQMFQVLLRMPSDGTMFLFFLKKHPRWSMPPDPPSTILISFKQSGEDGNSNLCQAWEGEVVHNLVP